MLAEYEAVDHTGRRAVLRREGLYSLLISTWREQRANGVLEALAKSSGPAPAGPEDDGVS